jgi:transposase-like protein
MQDMAQHFLRSPAARNFTLWDLTKMGEGEIEDLMICARWGSRETVVCPHCGDIGAHYYRRYRHQFRCRSCSKEFSITSATAFEHHRIPLKKLAFAIVLVAAGAKSVAALQLSRLIGVNPKTATMLLGKIREAIAKAADRTPLSGTVQVDGCWFLNRIRKPNRKVPITAKQVEERIRAQQDPRRSRKLSLDEVRKLENQRVVVAMRELHPLDENGKRTGVGARRTIVAVVPSESQVYVNPIAMKCIDRDAHVMTDEGHAFKAFASLFALHSVVNHQQCYVARDGTNNNQAESLFARFRRAEYGVVHRVQKQLLAHFAWEGAWKDDSRRRDQRSKIVRILEMALKGGRSDVWRGYYQKENYRLPLDSFGLIPGIDKAP